MKSGRIRRAGLSAAGALAALLAVYLLLQSPSHDRRWKPEYAELPAVEIVGDRVSVARVRDFSYAEDGTVDEARYHDATVLLSDLTSVWYGISHFGGFGLAHTFLSFGFADGRYLVISVEARQEEGESYGPLKGLLRNYELIYVIGEERDIIGQRTHVRNERVLLYELAIPAARAKRLFLQMLETVDRIHRRPAFYNTLTDNCTTNIVKNAESVSMLQRLFDYRVLLPGYSDGLAVEIGAIDTDLPLDALRESARLDPSGIALDDPDFSALIRRRRP